MCAEVSASTLSSTTRVVPVLMSNVRSEAAARNIVLLCASTAPANVSRHPAVHSGMKSGPRVGEGPVPTVTQCHVIVCWSCTYSSVVTEVVPGGRPLGMSKTLGASIRKTLSSRNRPAPSEAMAGCWITRPVAGTSDVFSIVTQSLV